ncbi:MAG: cell division protein FtsL [Ruminococcus sp.]|nr:cell division protein FtsL [Ruminococcus sp.]
MAETNSATVQKNVKNGQSKKNPQGNETGLGSVLSIIFIAALAAVLFGTVIYSLDRRNTVYSKVAELSNELTYAKAENVRLQTELESKISAKNVEDYAENVLGMKKIDPSQIKYIEIQTDDVVSIPEQDEGLVTKIKNFFDYCVEYFRG